MIVSSQLPEPLAQIRERRERAAIFVDFDGTLASIVEEPSAARPLRGTPELLVRLASRFALVAVVSGREASVLARLLGETPGVLIEGLYGLEKIGGDGMVVVAGEIGDAGEVEKWRTAVAEAESRAKSSAPEGAVVEHKGLTLTLHWRNNRSAATWAEKFAHTELVASGLVAERSRMALELRPPVEVNKGSVVERLAAEYRCDAIAYFGDDLGDLPAFDALDRLESTGARVARVAVVDAESPAEVARRADVVVERPDGAFALLSALADDSDTASTSSRASR